jgi:hypothetical protein
VAISWTINENVSGDIDFTPIFIANGLLINVEGNSSAAPTKAGYLKVSAFVEGELFEYSSKLIKFGKTVLLIGLKEYKLSFSPDYPAKINSATLKISPYNITQIMDILNPLPTSIGEQPVVDSLPTTFSAPQYLAATLPAAYQALPANTARQGFAIVNNGTAPVFLDLDAPTSATKRLAAIAVGGVFNLGFVYQGPVFIWSSNAVGQSVEVREFIQ